MARLDRGTLFNGSYVILEEIGAGGMGRVYKAREEKSGRLLAIKLLSPLLLVRHPREAARNLRRFRREAEILRLLQEAPHVVRLFDHGCSPNGDWFIAMEFLAGEPLKAYVGRDQRVMSIPTFLHLAKHLAQGLGEIHAQGIIHRDLAPDNIIVVTNGQNDLIPKYLDFGIGKSVTGELDQVTQMVTIMGKPQYFSPEQARGEEPGIPSDIYSLGVVLYEMLTGYVPLEVRGVPDFPKIQRDPPRPLMGFQEARWVPARLAAAIMTCLGKEAETRPALEEIQAALEAAEQGFRGGRIQTSRPERRPEVDKTLTLDLRETSLRPGDSINRYEIQSVLGRGGMGAVYLAWDPVLQREIAIKIATRVEGEKARKSILREARASSALRSENIVTIYEAGIDGQAPYIAMEYVPGQTLGELLKDRGPLSGEDFWKIARAVTSGLKEAHEREQPVIHRDLKPGNVLVGKDCIKITDFGIAKVVSNLPGIPGGSGAHGMAIGTAAIMSPEQAEGKTVDQRSDIYSLGCVLYMMATGQGPFTGNAISLLYQHCNKKPDPPSRHVRRLKPPELDRIILRCLEKDPDRRYQRAREVLADLKVCFQPEAAPTAPWWRSPRGLISATALLLMVALTVFFLRPRPSLAGPSSFAYTLQQVGEAPYSQETAIYYTHEESLPLRGTAEPRATLQVTFTAPGQKVLARTLVCDEEGEFNGSVSLPLVQFVMQEGGSLQASLRVKGDTHPPHTLFKLFYDPQPPTVEVSIRGGPWRPAKANKTLVTLRLLDLSFRFTDKESGFRNREGHPQHTVIMPLRGNRASWKRSSLSIQRAGAGVLVVQGTDLAGNNTGFTQTVTVRDPSVSPEQPRILTREKEVSLRVQVDGGGVDLTTGPLQNLYASVQELPGRRFPLKPLGGKRYEARIRLPELSGSWQRYSVTFHYEKRALPPRPSVSIVRDAAAPVIRLTLRDSSGRLWSLSSTKPPPASPINLTDRGNLQQSLRLLVKDSGPPDSLGPNPELNIFVRREGHDELVDLGRFPIEKGEEQAFPIPLPASSRPFEVRLTLHDAAGNTSQLAFTLHVTGIQILPFASAGSGFHGGCLYVQRLKNLPIEIHVQGLPPTSSLWMEVQPQPGSTPPSACLAMKHLGGDVWQGRVARLAGPAQIVIRDANNPGSEANILRRFPLVPDLFRPRVTARVTGLGGSPPNLLKVGALPEITLRLQDAQGVDFKLSDFHCTPPGLVARVTRREQGRQVLLSLVQKGGRLKEGTYRLSVTTRDLAGNENLPFSLNFQIAFPDIHAVPLLGQASRADQSLAGGPLFLKKHLLKLALANKTGVASFHIRARIRAGSRPEQIQPLKDIVGKRSTRESIPLAGTSGEVLLEERSSLPALGNPPWTVFQRIPFQVDLARPEIQIYQDGNPISLQELAASPPQVVRLDSLSIRVSDDLLLAEQPLLCNGQPPAKEGLNQVSATRNSVTYQLKNRKSWESLTLHLLARDRAGNEKAQTLEVLKVPEKPHLTTIDGKNSGPLSTASRSDLTRDAELSLEVRGARNVIAVRVLLQEEGGSPSRPTPVELETHDGGKHFRGHVRLPRDGTFKLRLESKQADEATWTRFKTKQVIRDRQPPRVHVIYNGQRLKSPFKVQPKGKLDIIAEDKNGLAKVTAALDGGSQSPLQLMENGRYLWDLTGLKRGPHNLCVQATDRAGNQSPKITLQFLVLPSQESIAHIEHRTGVDLVPITQQGRVLFYLSRTEITVKQYARFHRDWNRNPAAMTRNLRQEYRAWRFQKLQKRGGPVEQAFRHNKGFQKNFPARWITQEVAVMYCWWAGGRVPTAQEWVDAAARLVKPGASWPAYKQKNRHWSSRKRWLTSRQGHWSNYDSGKVMAADRFDAMSPFGLLGLAGNVSEWVSAEGALRLIGGSFKQKTSQGKLDVEDLQLPMGNPSGWDDLGIRLLVEQRD